MFMSSLRSRRQKGRVGQGPALTHPVVRLRKAPNYLDGLLIWKPAQVSVLEGARP